MCRVTGVRMGFGHAEKQGVCPPTRAWAWRISLSWPGSRLKRRRGAPRSRGCDQVLDGLEGEVRVPGTENDNSSPSDFPKPGALKARLPLCRLHPIKRRLRLPNSRLAEVCPFTRVAYVPTRGRSKTALRVRPWFPPGGAPRRWLKVVRRRKRFKGA